MSDALSQQRKLLLLWREPGKHRQLYSEMSREEAVENVTATVAHRARRGKGCGSAQEMDNAPCAAICECKREAEAIVDGLWI